MSLHEANKDKPRAQKCRHFCFSFDNHNYCPTCREAGKGDDPCVTFEAPCHICTSLTDEQLQKIQNRKRYLKKQKAETSSKDELDLLGEGDGDSFTGSNADLESAADNLFTSPPRPQPLAFSSLSLKTPAKAVPPTPGTVLQNKIQRNLEKSLGDSLNIHIQQQMGSFQASMLEAFQSLREELAVKKPVEVLPLSYHLAQLSRTPLINFNMISKLPSYLSEGKYVKPPPSTSKWYKVGQPTFQDKIQELNTDFAKICITPRPPGAPVAKVPLPVLQELEHQARQNISTLNFTAAFAKTSSSCNASLEKCQHSIKSTVKKIKSQIQKGANPEKAAKRGYEEVAEYLDFWNKMVLVQRRALTSLSKSLAHILQRELYSMANTGLLRREAEMTLLHPQLGETRRQELRNSSFWDSSLFESQLVKEGEDFFLKKGTSKDS